MATWYTDVATNQQQFLNFPGAPGVPELTTQPGNQNNALFEGPPFVIATYTWTGNEANNDIINICLGDAGWVIDPTFAHVTSGLTAPAVTLTIEIGDNDLALASALPIPNGAAQPTPAQTNNNAVGISAPLWVSGTTYAPGNVVYDNTATPNTQTYLCVAATSGTTAPHSAANTVWMPCNQRYSNSIDIHAASGNVAFSGGTQFYGGPASLLPFSITPNSVPTNMTAAQIANSQYQIQNDSWIQAQVLTSNTIAANTVSIFRIPVIAAN